MIVINRDDEEWIMIGNDTLGKVIAKSKKTGIIDSFWPPKHWKMIRYCDPATGRAKYIKRSDHSWL